MKKYNMLGFNKRNAIDYSMYRHCTIHAGARLIPSIDFPDMMLCPQCGSLYPNDLTLADTQITAKFTPKTMNSYSKNILTGNISKRRFYDSYGNEINIADKDIMQDIVEGRKIKYYHEEQPKGKKKYSF